MAVIEVNNSNFENEVLNSKTTVLADFYADWCGPCRMLRPTLEELADENKDCKFVSINIDEQDELADEYNISSIPCLVLFKNGAEVARSIGFKPKEMLEDFLGEN